MPPRFGRNISGPEGQASIDASVAYRRAQIENKLKSGLWPFGLMPTHQEDHAWFNNLQQQLASPPVKAPRPPAPPEQAADPNPEAIAAGLLIGRKESKQPNRMWDPDLVLVPDHRFGPGGIPYRQYVQQQRAAQQAAVAQQLNPAERAFVQAEVKEGKEGKEAAKAASVHKGEHKGM